MTRHYSQDEMAKLHAANDLMWFCNQDFVLTAARAHHFLGDRVLVKTKAGYKRVNHDSRKESHAFDRWLRRYGMALDGPTPKPKVTTTSNAG